jgi:hypothetical protein
MERQQGSEGQMKTFFDWFDDLCFKYIFPALFIILMCGGIFIFGYILWCAVVPESEERKARRIAEETPRVYTQVDGCKVYTWFADGRNHYFTRCPTKVTTESWHDERSGKTTKRVSETIETER